MPTSQMQYYDKSHNSIIIDKEIGKGGEGRVCLIKGNKNVVAKLYLDKALQKGDKSGKIKAMCDLYDNEIAKFSALPQKEIYDSNGKIVGFIMEHLNLNDFKEIHLLYGIKDRKKHFDYADWGFMVHSAKNLACAVETLHSKGIVIGDINQSNILVDNRAMIKLIDCDSYQVAYNGKIYLCEVGVPEYTSPELQGISFKGIQRTKNHDCFGLAVMIFKSLMFGRHPYSGVGAPPEIEKAIEQGYYCYGKNAINNTPIYSQLVSELFSIEIKELFERALTTNLNRPTAKEWINALDNLERGLHSCKTNNQHRYYGNSCIWCKLEQKGFQPFDTTNNSGYSQYGNTSYKQTPYKPQNTNYTNYQQPNKQKNLSSQYIINQQNQRYSANSQANYVQQTQQNLQTQNYTPSTIQSPRTANNINWKPIIVIILVFWFVGLILKTNKEIDNYTEPHINTEQTTNYDSEHLNLNQNNYATKEIAPNDNIKQLQENQQKHKEVSETNNLQQQENIRPETITKPLETKQVNNVPKKRELTLAEKIDNYKLDAFEKIKANYRPVSGNSETVISYIDINSNNYWGDANIIKAGNDAVLIELSRAVSASNPFPKFPQGYNEPVLRFKINATNNGITLAEPIQRHTLNTNNKNKPSSNTNTNQKASQSQKQATTLTKTTKTPVNTTKTDIEKSSEWFFE